jgi:hypothetical protein
MQADAAILNLSSGQIVVSCVISLAIIVVLVAVVSRHRPEQFRLLRVIGLTLLCLSTSLPFAWLYLRGPRNFNSLWFQADVLLMVFAPIIMAFVLGYLRKRKLRRK